MKTLTFAIFILPSIFFVRCFGTALDTAQSPQTVLKRWIDSQQILFSQLNSLRYQGVYSLKTAPEFAHQGDPYAECVTTFNFSGEGKKWSYVALAKNVQGVYASRRVAFDGTRSQVFFPVDGILEIGSGPLKTDTYLANNQYFFFPFKYLPIEKLQNAGYPLTLLSFSSGQNWNSLLLRIQNVKVDSSGGAFTFGLAGEKAFDGRGNYDYSVSVSDTGFPLRWIEDYASRNMREEYQVTRIAKEPLGNNSGMFFYYPSLAEIKFYENGKMTKTASVEVNDVEINKPMDDEFEIDPSLAETIQDLDHHKTILVPK